MATFDHRVLVAGIPSDGSELSAVSSLQDKVVTTQNPVETQTLHHQDSSVLPGSVSVSGDLGMAALSSFNQTSFPTSLGSVLRPPPLLLNSGLAGMGPWFPLASQALSGLPGVLGGFVPLFLFSCTPTSSVDGTDRSLPTFDHWIGSTSIFFAESAASIFSNQPSSSILDWVSSASFGDCF